MRPAIKKIIFSELSLLSHAITHYYEKDFTCRGYRQPGPILFKELKEQGYYVRVLARSAQKAQDLSPAADEVIIADATNPGELKGCCDGVDVVVSALGKSISLADCSKSSFNNVDYLANLNLLQTAKESGVNHFIYTSAFHAEKMTHLAYFKAHDDFSKALCSSGLSYTILQPTALFSAFDEVVAMAKKGRIANLGEGDKLTNPVFEGDLAKLMVQSIDQPSQVISVGGPKVYTRAELTGLACQAASYEGRIPSVPFAIVKAILPLVKVLKRNLYDKLAFLIAVCEQDCIAPATGQLTLESYFASLLYKKHKLNFLVQHGLHNNSGC